MKITISREGQQSGPYTVEEINARLRAGELKLHDWAWPEGASDWVSLGSIVGIDGRAPSAPVAAKPTAPRVVPAAPVAVNPSISGTPSGDAVAVKPNSPFQSMVNLCIIVFVGLIVSVWAVTLTSPFVGVLVIISLGLLVWYLFGDSKFAEARRQPRRQQELEQMRERVRQQMQRLVSDGAPYIQGQIVRLVGVNGLAKGACAIRFDSSNASIFLAHGKALTLPYGDIQLLQIGGMGRISESVNAGFIGGGFGIGGALQGAAEASLLNAAVSALTRKERVECELLMKWTTGELLMLNHEHAPEIVSHVLQPIIEKLG